PTRKSRREELPDELSEMNTSAHARQLALGLRGSLVLAVRSSQRFYDGWRRLDALLGIHPQDFEFLQASPVRQDAAKHHAAEGDDDEADPEHVPVDFGKLVHMSPLQVHRTGRPSHT